MIKLLKIQIYKNNEVVTETSNKEFNSLNNLFDYKRYIEKVYQANVYFVYKIFND